MLAVHCHLNARDEGVAIADGALHEALAVGWEVVGYRWPGDAEGSEINDVDIGLVAGRKDAAVAKAIALGRQRRLLAHQEFQRQLRPAHAIAGPVGQQRGRIAGIANRCHMRTAIAKSADRVLGKQHFVQHVEAAFAVVLEGPEQQAVIPAQDVEGQGPGILPRRLGTANQPVGRVRLEAGRVREFEGLRQAIRQPARPGIVGTVVDQAAAQALVLGQALAPACGRQLRELRPGGMADEGIDAGIEPHKHTDGPAADLPLDVEAGGVRGLDIGQGAAPAIRVRVDLQQQQRERPPRALRHGLQDGEVALGQIGIALDDAGIGPSHGIG